MAARRSRGQPTGSVLSSCSVRTLTLALSLCLLLLLTLSTVLDLLPLPSLWSLGSPASSRPAIPKQPRAASDATYPAAEYERPVSSLTHPLTLTTAYFPFPSKHSSDEYHRWLANFLALNPTPVVIFTTPAFYPQLAAIRYAHAFVNCSHHHFTPDNVNAPHRVACAPQPDRPLSLAPTHFNLSYASPLELPITALYSGYWDAQLAVDPERGKHTPTLYATWSAKAWLVNETAAHNPFGSAYFAWFDAGQFRNADRPWQSAVDVRKLAEVFGETEEGLTEQQPPIRPHDASRQSHPSAQPVASRRHKLLFSLVSPLPASYCRAFDPFTAFPATLLSDHTAGQSFLGTAPAIRWYAAAYYSLLLSYQQRGLVWGKDQNVCNALSFAYAGSVLWLGAWRLAGRAECVVGRGWDAHWSWMGEWLQQRGARRRDEGGCPEEVYAVDGMVVEGQAVCDGAHADWLTQSEEEASRLQGPPVQVAKAEAKQTRQTRDSG